MVRPFVEKLKDIYFQRNYISYDVLKNIIF